MASWDIELAEPIALKRGRRRFLTLRDAAVFLQERYGASRSGALEAALEGLLAAAESPSKAMIERATDQLCNFLSSEGEIEPRPYRAPAGSDLEARIRAMLQGRPLSPAAKAVRLTGREAANKKKPAGRTSGSEGPAGRKVRGVE